MKFKQLLRKLNWTNTLFLLLVPIVAFAGTGYLIANHAIHWQTILLTIFFTFAGGMSITAGYHRLFSHKTYKAAWPIRLFFVIFGGASFEGSVLEWCTDHRNHHRYTDTEKDPYNSKKGFWYSHIGWLFTLDTSKRDFNNIEELCQDPMLKFQHRFYVSTSILSGFILPMAIASLWGDAFGGLILAGALRIVLNQHFTFCINSVCHLIGKQTYSDRITARDNWISALLTYGEGYHNFHHQFPLDYRNAIKAYQYDPTKWLIILLQKMGLASDLRKVKQSLIVQYRLRMDERRMLEKAERNAAIKEHFDNVMKPVHETILQIAAKVDELEKSYANFKSMKDNFKMTDCRKRLREAKLELNYTLKEWRQMLSHSDKLMTAA